MNGLRPEDDLPRACAELFGPELGPGFLTYLQPSGLKAMYRRRARETHPDLFLGHPPERQHRQAEIFSQVHRAYEDLTAYLAQRDQRRRGIEPLHHPPPPFRPARPAGAPAGPGPGMQDDRRLPPRPLLFGHFLQYSGIIGWQDIVRALTWQRLNRPRLGELGHGLGWLRLEDLPRIARHQRQGQRFGASAVELGLLDPRQLDRLVLHQRRHQKKFGGYFVETRLLTSQELHQLLHRFFLHNLRHRPC